MPDTAKSGAAGEAGLIDDPGDVTFTGETYFFHKPSCRMLANPPLKLSEAGMLARCASSICAAACCSHP